MPYAWDEDTITEYWSFCGEVEAVEMLVFPDSGRFRGIAFVTFKSEEGFAAALGYDGEDLEGHTLKVGVGGVVWRWCGEGGGWGGGDTYLFTSAHLEMQSSLCSCGAVRLRVVFWLCRSCMGEPEACA
jgi:hypothetical protein